MNNGSVWDQEVFKQAWDSLTEEQRKDYMRVGNLVYNTIDYTTGDIIDASPNELQELLMSINAGIIRKVEDLDEDELKLLQHYYTESDISALFKPN